VDAELTRPQTALALGVGCSLSGRRWVWREPEPRLAHAIAQKLAAPDLLGRLLALRDVSLERVQDFLDPTIRALLPDPSTLTDMDIAAERLADAVQRGETVAVFGDYDVDGACSASLMSLVLRALGCTVIPYVPDRMTEGYGPNPSALRTLMAQGATLVVLVDCGTAASETLSVLDGQADAVVLDHHASQGDIPRVAAVVNPNRPDDASGLNHLCAAGVAFMAAVALHRTLRRRGFFASRAEPDLRRLLDLVALATVCDVMPLRGLNRAFVSAGLKVLARRERLGLSALLEAAQIKEAPTAMSLGWGLGPRINAGGRISEADLGVRLLLSDDPAEARHLAATLDSINRTRQTVEADILDAAMEEAHKQIDAGHACVLVAGAMWHPGVVGIVAGRLKERFNRPCCVAAVQDMMAKGSGRSVPGIDLGSAIIAARAHGLLTQGGGHTMAAGFTAHERDVPALHAFLDARLDHARQLPAAADLDVEGSVSLPACTLELAEQIQRLAPFGAGNPEPVLVLPRVRAGFAERIGREGNTLRVFLEGEGGGRLKSVLFRAGESALAKQLLARDGAALHVAGTLRPESWQGRVSLGFTIVDAAIAQSA
jgi:single-stranded-DNA-specific exonuclease